MLELGRYGFISASPISISFIALLFFFSSRPSRQLVTGFLSLVDNPEREKEQE